MTKSIARILSATAQLLVLYPPCIRRHSCIRRNTVIRFGTEKLEWYGYPTLKKFENMFTHFDTIHQRAGHTDRRTDGRTDAARWYRPRLCIASRSLQQKYDGITSQTNQCLSLINYVFYFNIVVTLLNIKFHI